MLRLFCIPWWSRSWEPTGVGLLAPVLCLSPGLRTSKIKQRADLVSACLVRTRSYSLEYPLNGQIGINTIQTWWGQHGVHEDGRLEQRNAEDRAVWDDIRVRFSIIL